MIRVLHFIGSLNTGGSQVMLLNLYKTINREKINFDFVVQSKKELFYRDEISSFGGKIYFLPPFKIGSITSFIYHWYTFLKDHPEYKIIHGHVRSTASIYLLIAKFLKRKTIIHSHSTNNGTGFHSFIKKILQFPIRYISDYFFSCSKTAGIWLFGKRIVSKKNFYIIKNAIDVNRFFFDLDKRNEIRNKLNIGDNFLIGNIGRFVKSKNHYFLLDLFKEILKRSNDIKLLLIGDGILFNSVKEYATLLSIQNHVIFIGNTRDVSGYLMAMDLFVFPSLYEGLGIVLIEAQATGLICITSNNVPLEETKLSNRISYHDLNDKTSFVEAILNAKEKINIKKSERDFIMHDYNVTLEAVKIEKLYIEINNTK